MVACFFTFECRLLPATRAPPTKAKTKQATTPTRNALKHSMLPLPMHLELHGQ